MSGPQSATGTPPALRLLGAPALAMADRVVPWAADRPHQLLAYLACKGDWARRDELAALLFPDRSLEAARSNLRAVLLRARRLQGVGEIEQRGDLLRWRPDSDLQRFEHACNAGRAAEALALYGGPLLLGMDSGWPAEAAEWLAGERSRLEGRWHDAAVRRLHELRDDPVAGEALARTLLRQDPLDEEAMQALLEAQRRQGRAGDALQALQSYAQQLSSSLDLEPSATLQGLGSALHGGASAPPTPAPAATSEGSDLVGRREELARIAERLGGTETRLLTLLGPGGIGKTALARTALARLGARFAGGAAWVELEAVLTPEQVPGQIAIALGHLLDARPEPWAALAQVLRSRPPGPCLVVLDNLEQLLPAERTGPDPAPELPARIAGLLHAVPELRLLATSRAALGLADEWRLALEGLPLPDADETDAEVLRANDAVRLFERRARPLAAGFALEDEAADVVRLVHAVEGLPLAICLLAAWRRLMPVREMVAELHESLELLEGSGPHERSVRAAFERSWQQLTPLQQRVLGQLALLPQPVDRAMLRAVVHAPLPVVASLVDRSLLQADGTGGFSMHALIRRLAAPLAVEHPALLERHALYMTGCARAALRWPQTTALAAMGDKLEHVRAAWRWALNAGAASLLEVLVAPLTFGAFEHGPLDDVMPTLRAAAAMLERSAREEASAGPATAALARVLTALGTLEFRLGEPEAAVRSANRVLRLAADAGLVDRTLRADALITLYNVHFVRGELAAAGAIVPRYQAEAMACGDAVRQAYGHTLAGLTSSALGRYDDAMRSFEAARTLHVEIGDTASLPRLLSSLGGLLRKMRRPHDAVRVLEEGLSLARRHGLAAAQPSLLTNLALANESLGDMPAMLRATERALNAARQTAEPFALMRALLAHGRALAARDGDLCTALAPVWRALRVAQQLRIGWERHECLISAARVAARCGRHGDALVLLRWVGEQPDLPADALASVQEALAEIGAADGPAAAAGSRPAADALVEDVLARLAPEPAADKP